MSTLLTERNRTVHSQMKRTFTAEIGNETGFSDKLAYECVKILKTVPGLTAITIKIKNTDHMMIVRYSQVEAIAPSIQVWLMKIPNIDRICQVQHGRTYRNKQKENFETTIEQATQKWIADQVEVDRLTRDMHSVNELINLPLLITALSNRIELPLLVKLVQLYTDTDVLALQQLSRQELVTQLLASKTKIQHNYRPLASWLYDIGGDAWKGIRESINKKVIQAMDRARDCQATCGSCASRIRTELKKPNPPHPFVFQSGIQEPFSAIPTKADFSDTTFGFPPPHIY